MSKTRITVKTIPTNIQNRVLEVSIYYDKGGMSMFGSGTTQRGYYISVTPVKIETFDGYTSRSITLFSGLKHLLIEAKRFSEKTLNDIAYTHSVKWNEISDNLVAKVCQIENIQI